MNETAFLQLVAAMAFGIAFGYPVARGLCFAFSWIFAWLFAFLCILAAFVSYAAVMLFYLVMGAFRASK